MYILLNMLIVYPRLDFAQISYFLVIQTFPTSLQSIPPPLGKKPEIVQTEALLKTQQSLEANTFFKQWFNPSLSAKRR